METYNKILYIVVAIVVFSVVLAIFNITYKKKIDTADNKEMSVSIRKKYFYIRFCIWILIVTYMFISILYIDDSIYTIMIFSLSLKFIDFITSMFFPVSIKLPKDISQEEKFVLYLRGFSSDNYAGMRSLIINNSDFNSFSEVHFVKILNIFFPVYTVGMPKELSSPYGAARIYLDDNVWEEDVSKLINMAEMVIVLVNDSDNCITEIEQCYNLNKTIFVVDDEKKFKKVSEYFDSKKHPCPFPTSIKSQTLLFDYNPHNSYSTLAYENSEKSYRKIIKQLMKERYGFSRLVLPLLLTDPTTVFCYILISLTLLIQIKPKSTNIEIIMYFLLITIIFVVVIKIYSLPMSKWRKIKEWNNPKNKREGGKRQNEDD